MKSSKKHHHQTLLKSFAKETIVSGRSNVVCFLVKHLKPLNLVRVQDSINAIEQLILDKNWEAARDAVVKLKYLEGIEIAAKDKWHELSR